MIIGVTRVWGNVIPNKLSEVKFAVFANLGYKAKLALEMLQMNKRRRRVIFPMSLFAWFGKTELILFWS